MGTAEAWLRLAMWTKAPANGTLAAKETVEEPGFFVSYSCDVCRNAGRERLARTVLEELNAKLASISWILGEQRIGRAVVPTIPDLQDVGAI